MPTSNNYRIQVIGTSGSGKTTLARDLAKRLGIQHLELDSLHHQADWTPLPETEFRSRVTAFAAQSGWVIDGNYSVVRNELNSRITHLIWLDYPRWFVMWRLLRRTLWRAISRKELWNGNREAAKNMFSRDAEINVLLWSWTTHGRNRVRYEQLFKALPEVTKIRIGSPFQVNRLLSELVD
jgi:adenylate kinase family enzyme